MPDPSSQGLARTRRRATDVRRSGLSLWCRRRRPIYGAASAASRITVTGIAGDSHPVPLGGVPPVRLRTNIEANDCVTPMLAQPRAHTGTELGIRLPSGRARCLPSCSRYHCIDDSRQNDPAKHRFCRKTSTQQRRADNGTSTSAGASNAEGTAPATPRGSSANPQALTLKVNLKLHRFSTTHRSRRSHPILNLQLEP